LRDQAKEFERRGAQVLLVEANESYRIRYLLRQAKRDPKEPRNRPIDKVMIGEGLWLRQNGELAWPVVTDPAGIVGASYGVFGAAHFLSGESINRPALFVIDRDSAIRFMQHYKDTQGAQADDILRILDDLEDKRTLISALKEQGAELAKASALVLGPVGPQTAKALPVLRQALREGNANVRAGAAAALGWLGFRAEPAVPALAQALEDEDRRVRRLSAEALARIGPGAKAAAPALIKALNDADEQARREFARLLRRSGPSAQVIFPSSVQEIQVRNEHVRVRAMAVAALERIGSSAVPALIDTLTNTDPAARINAAEALGRLGEDGKPAAAALTTILLKDKDARVREAAAHAFSKLPHYDSALVVALKDSDPGVRAAAIHALEHSGGLAHWEAVLAHGEALNDRDAAVREGAYGNLDHRADASVDTLLRALKQKDGQVRARAAEVLGQLAVEAMKRTADEGRLRAALIGEAAPVLTKAVKDDDPRVRTATAEAVKKIDALKKTGVEKR
jgi:HEAT repeat protein